MPVVSNHRTDQQLSNDMNTDNRKIRDDIDDISKIATSTRPKYETLRANSPTFKRLVAVRIKLEKYVNLKSNIISPSQEFISEISNHEKPSTATTIHISSAQKRIKSKSKPRTAPLDKITYEKTSTHNGNVKQKCSLEIWLPKAGSDEEDENTSRTSSPDHQIIIGNDSQSIKSRRSSAIKFAVATTINSETKSLDETSSKKSEPTIIPRVYHYEEYLGDQSDERPRSSKSVYTNKSDGNNTNKTFRRQRIRPNPRRLSPSTNNTEESVRSSTSALPMSSKNLLTNLKQTYGGHEIKGTVNSNNNSAMINELMRKYSMIKRSHQELTQPRLQLEKPYQDSKKDHSLSSPPASDSASHTSSDQPVVSGRKLLADTLPHYSTGDSTSTKLIDHRPSNHKSSYPEVYPQTRLFSLVNHLQHRQTSGLMPNAILPTVLGRKNEEPFRSFERSKTLDVFFAIPNDNTTKVPSRLPAQLDNLPNQSNSSNILPRTINENLSKRSLPLPSHNLRTEQVQQQISQPLVQLVQYQNIQNTAQRYHLTTHSSPSTTTTTTTKDLSTNKVLVHLKYSNGGNTDRNCLIPE